MLGFAARNFLARGSALAVSKTQRRPPSTFPARFPIVYSSLQATDTDAGGLLPMGKKACYAVAKGRTPGIYRTWGECSAQVNGFKGSVFKGFKSEAEALQYLAQHGVENAETFGAAPLLPTSAKQQQNHQSRKRPHDASTSNTLENSGDLKHSELEDSGPSLQPVSTINAAVPSQHVAPGSTARLQFDGASKRNPGPAAFGAVMYDAATGLEAARVRAYMGDYHTNNQAEYAGLIAGLQKARELGYDNIEVQGDSKLVVNQVLGRWQVKNEGLRPYHATALALSRKFNKFSAKQVPRAENAVADALGNEAIDAWRRGVGGEIWTLEKAKAAIAEMAEHDANKRLKLS